MIPKKSQMTPNDPIWPHIIWNDPEWQKMSKNDVKWTRMTLNNPKWTQMTPNDPKCPWMTPNGPKWPQMVPNLSVFNLPVSCWFDHPGWAKLTFSATGLEFRPDRAWNSSIHIKLFKLPPANLYSLCFLLMWDLKWPWKIKHSYVASLYVLQDDPKIWDRLMYSI